MKVVRAGVFDVWREDRLVGTETYRTFRSATGDTLYTFSVIAYDTDGDPDSSEYAKQTVHMTRALDQTPLFFQTIESASGTTFRASAAFEDTVVQVYQEDAKGGQGWTLTVPEGKLYLLDPGVYQLIEFLAGDFSQRGARERTHNVFVLRSRSNIEVRLTRGEEEEIEWPAGRKKRAVAIELTDGLTSFTGWFDDDARLLVLEVPAYASRIVRRPDEGGGSR
jgi:hypothetical protein